MRGARNIGLAARELGVVDFAAPDELVLQFPGQRGFRILLHIARQDGVATSADGDIERRPRPPRIGEAGGKPDVLDETLRVVDGLHLPRLFAAPPLVAVFFNLVWNVLRFSFHLLPGAFRTKQVQVNSLAHRLVPASLGCRWSHES